jgi:hypothetical protein
VVDSCELAGRVVRCAGYYYSLHESIISQATQLLTISLL